MNDFIFGTLATEELRRERVQSFRAGVSHNFRRTPVDPLPGQPIQLHLSIGPDYPVEQAWVYWTTDGSDPAGQKGVASQGHTTAMSFVGTNWDTELWGYRSHYEAVLPAQSSGVLLRYRISAEVYGGGEIFADLNRSYALYIAADPTPAWAQDAVIYQIFVDRFFPGSGNTWLQPSDPSGFYGGRLKGITEKLDYLANLGVNTLWLTPVFPSPSHHGYDATDLFEVEPRLGSKADLRELFAEAHARNIRVLLDFVPNHISYLHPIFQKAVQENNHPYREWFTFTRWPDQYETFFGVAALPQINLRHPDARQHVLDAAKYWLELGADGYRVDYGIGPSPDFWAAFRQVTRSVKPDCWTFGEIVDPPDVQLSFAGLLDGSLDFMLLEAFRQSLAFGRWNAPRLAGFLDRHEAYFPADFSRPSFLDNHDMNRFLWAAGNDQRRLCLAAVCQFTLSGPPVIYYGTEVGLSQERDVRQDGRGLPEESRLPMLWEDRQDGSLLRFYRDLILLRNQHHSLRSGWRHTIYAEGSILAYQRGGAGITLTVVLNLADQPVRCSLPGKHSHILLACGEDCQAIFLQYTTELSLPPLGAIILQV